MNRALLYLWWSLLQRRARGFFRSLRRPTSLIGALAVAAFLGILFYFRESKFMGELVRKQCLLGGALVLLWGSMFKGFLQRGLLCELADIQFLFTSPFTHRQVVLYRLLPNYLFAIVQGFIFLVLFVSHLAHPLLTALCLTLFQIACFHVATAAAIFGGAISEQAHHRLRWMMLAGWFFIAALYLRLEWDFKIVPAFCSSPVFQLLFYPAVNLPDAVNASALHQWALKLQLGQSLTTHQLWLNLLYVGAFAVAALGSLWLLLQLRINPFESALAATNRVTERRQRLQEGRRTFSDSGTGSSALPMLALFRGVGAIAWKNLVAVKQCRREMLLAATFVFIYTGFFTALLWIYHSLAQKAGGAPLYEERGFTTGIAGLLGVLTFFLQRMFPFDFRRDGRHLVNFRTLPISPLALTLAEISVPTALCLVAQACGVIPLLIFGKFDWPTLVFILLGYPAVSLALNAVWNLYYLMAAVKPTGPASSGSAVGMLMVVALSFLVFYPAGWVTVKVANQFITDSQTLAFTLAAASGLAVQYAIDLLLVLAIARLFQRFEVAREG